MQQSSFARLTFASAVSLFFTVSGAAFAQHRGHSAAPASPAAPKAETIVPGTAAPAAKHDGHHPTSSAKPANVTSASTAAYKAINDKMHQDMAIAFSGDADFDFVRGHWCPNVWVWANGNTFT